MERCQFSHAYRCRYDGVGWFVYVALFIAVNNGCDATARLKRIEKHLGIDPVLKLEKDSDVSSKN